MLLPHLSHATVPPSTAAALGPDALTVAPLPWVWLALLGAAAAVGLILTARRPRPFLHLLAPVALAAAAFLVGRTWWQALLATRFSLTPLLITAIVLAAGALLLLISWPRRSRLSPLRRTLGAVGLVVVTVTSLVALWVGEPVTVTTTASTAAYLATEPQGSLQGTVAWDVPVTGSNQSERVPVVAGTRGPVVAQDDAVTAYDAVTGEEVWTYHRSGARQGLPGADGPGAALTASPAGSYVSTVFWSGTATAGTYLVETVVLDALTGATVLSLRRTLDTDDAARAGAVLTDGVAVIDGEGIDLATGATLWTGHRPVSAGEAGAAGPRTLIMGWECDDALPLPSCTLTTAPDDDPTDTTTLTGLRPSWEDGEVGDQPAVVDGWVLWAPESGPVVAEELATGRRVEAPDGAVLLLGSGAPLTVAPLSSRGAEGATQVRLDRPTVLDTVAGTVVPLSLGAGEDLAGVWVELGYAVVQATEDGAPRAEDGSPALRLVPVPLAPGTVMRGAATASASSGSPSAASPSAAPTSSSAAGSASTAQADSGEGTGDSGSGGAGSSSTAGSGSEDSGTADGGATGAEDDLLLPVAPGTGTEARVEVRGAWWAGERPVLLLARSASSSWASYDVTQSLVAVG